MSQIEWRISENVEPAGSTRSDQEHRKQRSGAWRDQGAMRRGESRPRAESSAPSKRMWNRLVPSGAVGSIKRSDQERNGAVKERWSDQQSNRAAHQRGSGAEWFRQERSRASKGAIRSMMERSGSHEQRCNAKSIGATTRIWSRLFPSGAVRSIKRSDQ